MSTKAGQLQTTLARTRVVADVVLIGGDEDLRRGVEEAQDHGTRVHLWGVEAAEPEYNQSQSLIAESDRRWVIPAEWLMRFIHVKEPPVEAPVEPETPEKAEIIVLVPEPPQDEVVPSAGSATERATPEQLEDLVSTFGARTAAPVAEDRGWSVTPAPRSGEIPTLRELTSAAQAWKDNEHDNTSPGLAPLEVGVLFGERWADRASVDQLAGLAEHHPRAPNYLDGEMLRFAGAYGIDTWDDEPAKHAIRKGFWRTILARSGSPE